MAMVTEANKPTRGSTPASTEKLMASGINASATTNPPRISVRSRGREENAKRKLEITPVGADCPERSGAEAECTESKVPQLLG